LLIRRALATTPVRPLASAAVLLGLAASMKNEGLTLIVAVAFGLAASGRPRLVSKLWPAVAIAGPWLVLTKIHHLTSDLATSGAPGRAAARLAHPAQLVLALIHHSPGRPLFWGGCLLALAIGGRSWIRKEGFVLSTLLLQLLFYIGAYLVTPHDLVWQVRWSWERLVSHLTPLIAVLAFSSALSLMQPVVWRRRS
jgi:hypothetical protein